MIVFQKINRWRLNLMAKFQANPFTQGKQELDQQAKQKGMEDTWYNDSAQPQQNQQLEPGYRANRSHRTGR